MASWTAMSSQDFDAAEDLTLFSLDVTDNSGHARPDDACGTPDLFTA